MRRLLIRVSLEQCVDLIKTYQENEDREVFLILLAKFDLLLIDILLKIRKRNAFLQDESLQEMYHTAVIAFARALKKFRVGIDNYKLIPAVIKAYVTSAIKSYYRYKKREVSIDIKDIEWSYTRPYQVVRDFRRALVRSDLRRSFRKLKLTDEELLCLKMFYYEKLTKSEICKELGLTIGQVKYRIRRALEKLKLWYNVGGE